MKNRTIFLSLFCLFSAFSVHGQTVSAGIRAGYSLTGFFENINRFQTGGNDANQTPRALSGFHIGFDSRTAWGSRWALLTGILYQQKGFKRPVYLPAGVTEGKYISNYLSAPLLAECRIWKGFSVQAGAEAGYLVNAVLKFDNEKANLNDFRIYKNFDLGLAAGLEYRTERGFFAGIRQTWGVINAYDEVEFTDEYGNSAEVKGYNRALQVSAGYRYTW